MFSVWLLLVLQLHLHSGAQAAKTKCVPFACYVFDLNPAEEGSLTVPRYPDQPGPIYFTNLNISSLNISLLEQMGLIEEQISVNDSPIRNVFLSSDIKLNVLSVKQTNLSDITFERNNTHLERLTINGSLLMNIPATVDHLEVMQHISITYAPISSVNLSHISRLPNLLHLDLTCNKIKHLHYTTPTEEDFPCLSEIYLSHNELTALNVTYFSYMKRLKEIGLANNHIMHVDGALVLSNLRYLDLSLNVISAFNCCSWSAQSMKSLLLDHNMLEWLPSCFEYAMPNVEYLHLSSNALGDDEWGRLNSLKKLQYLNLNFNKFTSVVLENVLSMLYFVSMQHNRITYVRVPCAKYGLGITVRCNLIEQFVPDSVTSNVTSLDMKCNPIDNDSACEDCATYSNGRSTR